MKKYETYIYIVKNLDGGNHMNLIVLAPVGATVALLFAAYFTYTIFKVDEGTDSMKHIAESIRKGANAYLKRQYIAVGKFFVVILLTLSLPPEPILIVPLKKLHCPKIIP